MRRGLGGSAGLIALLALVLHTQSGTEPTEYQNVASPGSKAKPKPGAEPAAQVDQPAQGPWLATQAFFNVPLHPAYDPDHPNPADFALLKVLVSRQGAVSHTKLRQLLGFSADAPAYSSWSVVATVADPRHTRLSLFFDRQIEAIERSLQALDWEFSTQWLPWMDPFDADEKDINERRRQRSLEKQQEEFPGILVFRHTPPEGSVFPSEALFVLLVPETPTAGVNGPSFFAATRIAEELSTGDHKIGLLGPTFSGSLFSLANVVLQCRTWPKKPVFSPKIYGGSISGRRYVEAFAKQTGLMFSGGIAPTDDYKQAFKHVITRYGIEPRQAAYLVEDESAFSESFKSRQPDDEEIPSYIFPRDINHLRNAYREGGSGPAGDRRQIPGSNIDFSIQDPNEGEDGIPTFSDKQTPLSQDAAVASITDEMKHNGTRIVYIAATNSLDALFLARLVRQDSPDIRVLIGNADILFVPAASQSSLTGTLFLSTYPMFFKGDEWLNHFRFTDRLSFPGPDFQGIFNVAHMLLADMGAARNNGPQLRGYAQFVRAAEGSRTPDDRAHPGLWLLSQTRSGFYPIDLLHEDHQYHDAWFERPPGESNRALPDDPPPPFEWRLAAIVLSVGIFGGCFLLFGCNVRDLVSRPVWLGLTDGHPYRILALLGACLSASALEWILAFPLWRAWFSQSLAPVQTFLAVLTFLASLAPIATLVTVVIARKLRDRLSWSALVGSGARSAVYGGLTVLLFLLVTSVWAYACLSQETVAAAFLFRFRAQELFSGASPALPLTILSLQFFVFSMFYFKRYTRAGVGRPHLALAEIEWPAIIRERDQIEKHFLAPAKLDWGEWWRRTVVSTVAVIVTLMLLGWTKDLWAFEIPRHNLLLVCGVAVALYSIAVNCYDLTLLWRHVRKLLGLIELLPLKTALKRVSREWPRQPIWAFRRSVSREQLDRQMLYALHNRKVLVGRGVARAAAASSTDVAGSSVIAAGTVETSWDPVTQYEEFADTFRSPTERAGQPIRDLAAAEASKWLTVDRRLWELQKYERISAELATAILRQELAQYWRCSVNDDSFAAKDDAAPTGSVLRVKLVPPDTKDDLRPEDDAPQGVQQKILRYGSDFVALQLSRYIVYIVEQTRRVALHVSVGFLLLTLLLNSYVLQAPLAVSRFLAVAFLIAGLVVCRVLAGMERHPILSRIARTKPGELNREFWIQLVALGGLPFLGVMAHLFPSISRFLFSWVAPSVEALH